MRLRALHITPAEPRPVPWQGYHIPACLGYVPRLDEKLFGPAAPIAGIGPVVRRVQVASHQPSDVAFERGVSGFTLVSDDPRAIERYGREAAPAFRDAVARERGRASTRCS